MPIHHTHSIAGIPHQANASLPPLVFIHTFLSVTIIGLLKDLHKYRGLLHTYISMEYPKGNAFTVPIASRNFPLAWDRLFLEPAISKPLIMLLISKGTFNPYSNFEIDSLDF